MIKDAVLGKEMVISLKNKIGALADISKLLADHGLNIEGVAGYATDGDAKIMLVVDDTLRAGDALKKKGYSVKESEVVMVDLENKAGALKVMTAKLASEGIDIKYAYGTVCAGNCPARIVLATSNNEKTEVALKR